MIDALGRPQRILLVGGTSDIGVEIVKALAGSQTQVVLAGRNQESLTLTAANIEDVCAGVEVRLFDVERVEDMVATLTEVFSRDVDVAIIAVGILPEHQVAVAEPAVAVQSLAVNGFGAAAAFAHIHAHMCRQGHGQVVALSSIAASRPRPSNYIYGAGKSMLDFLARGAVESPDPRVRVLLLRPGFVRTRMTRELPAAPFAVGPHDIATAVSSWSRRARGSSIVWVPGILGLVARVLSLLPLAVLRKVDR